nr:hypothetical protein BaRGS_020055 [Batillaria attramentaria]
MGAVLENVGWGLAGQAALTQGYVCHSYPLEVGSEATVACAQAVDGGLVSPLQRPNGILVCPPVMKNLLAAIEYYGATIFFNYVSTCGLNSTLQNMQENLTVFAPANTAFETLPSTTLKKLETDFNFACETIKFHISPGPVSLTANNTLYPTMSGYNIRVNIYTSPNITTVSGSTLLLTNNTAQNGVLNVLGKVMYPVPTGSALSLVIDSSNFTILLLALAKAGLTPVLDLCVEDGEQRSIKAM